MLRSVVSNSISTEYLVIEYIFENNYIQGNYYYPNFKELTLNANTEPIVSGFIITVAFNSGEVNSAVKG